MYGLAPLPNIKCGLFSARSRMVCAKTLFAHANQLRVYLAIRFTSTLSWTRPRRHESRTMLMDSITSASEFAVRARTSTDIGQAFCRPTTTKVVRCGLGKKIAGRI